MRSSYSLSGKYGHCVAIAKGGQRQLPAPVRPPLRWLYGKSVPSRVLAAVREAVRMRHYSLMEAGRDIQAAWGPAFRLGPREATAVEVPESANAPSPINACATVATARNTGYSHPPPALVKSQPFFQ